MTHPPPGRTCAGLVLTGGASRRFGAPKAEARIGHERLADRAARLLLAVAAPVLEVGPGHTGLPALLEEPAGTGPLAAVAAGADALAARGIMAPVLVLAVDLPLVDASLLALLAGWPASDAVVPRVHGRPQPLCARYSAAVLAHAGVLVARGSRAMRDLLRIVDVTWLDDDVWGEVASPDAFADVDTSDDARRLGVEPPG